MPQSHEKEFSICYDTINGLSVVRRLPTYLYHTYIDDNLSASQSHVYNILGIRSFHFSLSFYVLHVQGTKDSKPQATAGV